MLRLLSILVLFFLLSSVSFAQEAYKDNEAKPVSVPKADFKALKHTKSGKIDKVIDGLTILLNDGTVIRLASLHIPDFHVWRNAPYSEAALHLLEETLPEGTEVMVYQTRMAKKGRITRMKHELAHIETKKDPIWINGLLLSQGLAQVYTSPDATEMLDQMLQIESTARAQKLGSWEDSSEFPVLTPETTNSQIGNFAIIQGVVQKVATVRNNLYLNFGQDWKTDFTIMITPDLRKQLSHNGIEAMSLANNPVRVRGWLREYNGPLIELEDPSHLEIIQGEIKAPLLQNKPESPSLKPTS